MIEIHKRAVAFRNKKREEYLKGKLSSFEMDLVERWDCEPSEYIKELARKIGTHPSHKMFNVLLSEEPLSVDIQIKAKERAK